MTFSKTATLGCLAILTLTASVQGWSAQRLYPPIKQPLGAIAPIVLSNADLRGNTSKGYRPWFENGSWQGDLVEYTVTAAGGLNTSVDFSQTSPRNIGNKANWSALVNFAATNASYWDSPRKIITFNGSSNTQGAFRFTDAGIGTANKMLLEPGAQDGASKILNFVRGDRSNEYPKGAMRKRTSILGDIIHSKPVYVGAPNDTRTEDGYAAWAAERRARAPRVYVGANDGMLHVFDAANGNEVYAYVPSMLMGSLGTLTARPYQHRYFVDGEMSVRDAHYDGSWHTVLAGSLGAGGKGFFVLDVTDPNLASESSNTGANKKVLFEYSGNGDDTADDDLGDSFSRPVIAKLNDGHWYVVTGNGYNSANGVAKLYLVNLDTLVLTKISTSSGTGANPNGLSSPSLLDTNRDGTADYAYAGDIDGNLWKFDLSAANTSGWEVAYNGRPLHPTAGGQAIVQAPQIALHPRNGYMLYFATGRLFTTADVSDTSVQSLYGIWDSGATPPNANSQNLLKQTWDGPKTYNYTTGGSAATQTIAIYNEDAGNPDWASQHGWKVDFPKGGYRVLQPVQVRANRVKATVYKPNKLQLGENWLVEAVLADGGPNPPAAPIYDLNVDGVLNVADLYNNAPEGENKEWHVPMMWRQAVGNMSQVTIAFLANGVDALFVNYLQQPITTDVPCTRSDAVCPSGFLGGHIDVQTYDGDVPLGGEPTGYTDAYDSKTKKVWVDFFDLYFPVRDVQNNKYVEEKSVFNQVEIDSDGTGGVTGYPKKSSGISNSEEFIVLVANADLSPGSTLRIGDRTWNVMEYQRQIHNALKNWNTTDAAALPRDMNGNSLVFSWGQVKNLIAGGTGTIIHEFDDRAIIDGGLHPTQPECVGNPTGNGLTKGRWRNGALTTQLVKKSYFTSNPTDSAIKMVNVQQPDDLPPYVTTKEGNRVYTTINYDDDLYETVGGLYAKGDAEHIWESTVFWHFGEFAELAGMGRPCYGDADWKDAVTFELSNDPVSATLAALGENFNSDALLSTVEALRLQGCDNAQAQCYQRWATLSNLLDLSKEFIRTKKQTVIGNAPGPSDPTPRIILGGTPATITEGTSYEPGRMSWTDIVK